MKVLIAGLSDQSALAMQRVVASVFQEAQVIRQQRGVSLDQPGPWAIARQCDLCIVDLIGMGLARWTAQRQAQLQAQVLGEHSTVILAPPGDGGGWLDAMPELQATGGSRLLMQHPLTASTVHTVLTALRTRFEAETAARQATTQALAKAAQAKAKAPMQPRSPAPKPLELHDVLEGVPRRPAGLVQPAAPAPGLPAAPQPAPAPRMPRRRGRLGAPLPPAWDEAPETFSVASDEPARPAPLPAGAPAQPQAFEFSAQALQALLAVCPEVGQNAYLHLICTAALKAEPQAFQIGSHSGVVVHAGENWVVSNISSAMRRRLTAHAMMLQIVETRTLQDAEAFAAAARFFGRRQDGRRPLDTFIWGLAYGTFAAAPPLARSDLCFQLRRFPNFSRMVPQPDLFIQLALLSLRAPQSIDGLVSTFSRHDPRLVMLFVLCAVLSGSARVLPTSSAITEGKAVVPASASRRNLPGLQFFRSLLEKLF